MLERNGSFRGILLTGTRDLHDELDRQTGKFSDGNGYAGFLSGSHAFRAALEEALLPADDWAVEPLSGLIAQDLADLGQPLPPALAGPVLPSRAARAGALYVLEGSALGARLLARRAAALGFDGHHGARHLAAQTAERGRWSRFLEWLEGESLPRAQAVSSAREVFALALQVFGAKVAA